MKICLLSYDTRTNNNNVELLKELNQKYCDHNKYDFIFDYYNIDNHNYSWEEMISDEKNLFLLKLYYHRFEMFEKYIDKYDYVVSIDSDITFVNPNKKIEELIDNQHDFFISQDSDFLGRTLYIIDAAQKMQKYLKDNDKNILTNPHEELTNIGMFNGKSILDNFRIISANPLAINCGFIILKNTPLIKKFINDFKKYYFLFEKYMFDQGCSSYLLETKKYKNILKILPLGLQGNPFLDNRTIFGFNENLNFLVHFYGFNSIKVNEITNIINEIKTNKWWSQIK